MAILTLATLLIYGRALRLGYLSDDFALLGAAVAPDFSLFDPFPAGTGAYFRPLVMASLRLAHHLPAPDAAPVHHLLNLLFHLVNGVLIFALSRRLTRRPTLALALALLFVAHPANVTNVYWISGRTDSLVTLCILSGLLSFSQWRETGGRFWFSLTGVALLGGLLAKESGVVFVPLLLAIRLLRPYREQPLPPHQSAERPALILFSLGATAYLLYLARRFYWPAPVGLPVAEPAGMVEALLTFPILLALPNRQSALIHLYRANPWLLIFGAASLAIGLVTAVVWLQAYSHSTRRLLLVLASLVLIPLAPVVVATGGLSSRHIYLPLAMLCVAAAGWAAAGPDRFGRRALTLLYVLAALLALAAYQDGGVWLRNWQLTQAYCHTFQTALRQAPPDPPLLFLTMPHTLQDAPLYSNDLNEALYFCRHGRFGRFSRLSWTGSMVAKTAVANNMVIIEQKAGNITALLPSPDSYFLFPPGARLGQIYTSALFHLTITALHDDGLVSGFTITLPEPALLDRLYLFAFTGAEFELLYPTQPQAKN
jgi:hypothetical protein